MLSKSWESVQDELFEYQQGKIENLSEESEEILLRLGFLTKKSELTTVGEQFYDAKFIFDRKESDLILRDRLLTIKEVRELCQAFYGQSTNRKNVEIFLKSKTGVKDDKEIGRLLILLNKVDVVDYSKRTSSVTFNTEDLVEAEGQESYRVTTRTPYSNVKRLRRCIRQCSGTVRWFDKHFSKKGLEPLSDEISGDNVAVIQILCGLSNVNSGLRDDFSRFKDEMDRRGVNSELRVILSGDSTYHQIHDRWILSDSSSWNLPPIDSLYQNQEAEIYKTGNDIPFDKWWGSGVDIIDEWDKIYAELDDNQVMN